MTISPKFNDWIVQHRKNPHANLRMFCFPYAGGGASIYRTWPEQLPIEVELYAIQLPGRETRLMEKPFDRLTNLVPLLTEIIKPYLDKPFVFFGHSLGALISFELARNLRRQYNLCPSHLFVSARRAPQIPDPDKPVHLLSDEDFMAELRKFNGTPEAILKNAELMQLLIPLLRADFAISETYVYKAEAALDCPITVFGGTTDPEARQEHLPAWQQQTNQQFKLKIFNGDHFFINSARPLLLQEILYGLKSVLASLPINKI